jgi:NIMA (never in mitosis gene a)-related kinase
MQQSKKKSEDVGSKLSDFKIQKELGRGSYGTVYTVKSNINSNIYVMKKMELNHLKPKQQRECYHEVSILKRLNHPNIIKYYSSFLENENLYIIWNMQKMVIYIQ